MHVDVAEPITAAATDQRRSHTWRRRGGAFVSYLVMAFVLITLNFLLPRAMPGDPIEGLLGQSSATFTFGEDTRTALREYYGLERSLASQYGNYLGRLVQADLGRSIVTNTEVTEELGRRLPWTLLLVVTSTVVAMTVGVIAGIHSGWRRDRPMDRVVMTGLISVWQFPPYLLGSLLLFLFAVKLGWFPLSGGQTPFSENFSLLERVLDIGRHLLLPLLVLTTQLTAWNYLVMRAGMVSELGSDYLLLGRAKGLLARRLKYRYAARNALLPVVSSTGVNIGFAVAGNVVVERVFSYPGLGQLLFASIGSRDYPTIQGVFLVLSLSVVTVNALADALNRRLDPRTAT